MRTANKDKDNFQLNQYLFKIPADFPAQCSDACLALHCEKTSRTSTNSGRCIRRTEVATEKQLWREITSRQSFRSQKRTLSVTRCL